MIYVKLLAAIGLIGSIAWAAADPGFESGLAVVGSLSALVSSFLVEKRIARRGRQHQSVSNSSIGVQAGGNVNIGNVDGGKNDK